MEIIPAVPHALGQVTQRQGQLVSIRFADTESNPKELRNGTKQFKLDVGPAEYHTGDWVVASWKRAPRTDKRTGALLVQGSVGAGCHLRPLPRAASERGLQSFLATSASQLSSKLQQRTHTPQGTVPGPDPANFLSAIDPTVTAKGNGPPRPWLPLPVPVLGAEHELGMPPGYIRIGYVGFTVDSPVEEIRIEEASPSRATQTLRSRTAIQKDNWHSQQQVTITLTLHGLDAINEVLLPIVRLFKKAPFLPVFNHLLFEADITALSLQSLQTSTIPGYPNALKAVLVCWSFNWEAYLPLAHEAHGLDSLFCYPLLKIWAEKPYPHTFSPRKIDAQWDGEFRMYLPSIAWLTQTNEFPSVAARARRVNNDLDAIELAALWSADHGLADQRGFKESRAFPNLGGIGVGSARILTLDSAVGRIVVGHSSYTFLRLTDVALARAIANDPDCVSVLKGSVNIVNRSGMPHDPIADNSAPALVDTDDFKGGPREFVGSLDDADPTTLKSLEAGHYVFMVHMHSFLFATVARQRRPQQPTAPSDQPQADTSQPFTPTSMVIEQLSCSMDNVIVPLQVRGKGSATHQYMGSNNLSFQIVGTLQSYEDLHQIKGFLDSVHKLGRDFRGSLSGKPFGGFCVVDNEIFHMLGVRHVLPVTWEATTIPDFPNALRFTMTLVEFDVTQRRREAISDLMKGVTANPLLSVRSEHDEVGINWIRQGDLNRRLRTIELYPDLALPTHTELSRWIRDIQLDRVWDWEKGEPFPEYAYLDPENGGSGWQWSQQVRLGLGGTPLAARLPSEFCSLALPDTHPDRFADPDFYCAPSQKWGVAVMEGLLAGTKVNPVVLHDSYGTQVEILPGQALDHHLVAAKGNDPQDTMGVGQKAVDELKHPEPVGSSAGLVDGVLSGRIQAPTAAPAPQDAAQRRGDVALIPAVPAAHDGKKGGSRPRVAVDDSGGRDDRYNRYAPLAAAAAQAAGVPKDVFFALIEQESDWSSTAKNGPGRGFGQIEPAAQHDLGIVNIWDPTENLYGAARYLRRQLDAFGGDVNLALGAYNQGAGTIKRHGGLTEKATAYVNRVRKRQGRYQADAAAPNARFLAEPAFDPLIKVQMAQKQKEFNSGHAYRARELAPYIIPEVNTDSGFFSLSFLDSLADRVLGPSKRFDPKNQFIPSRWLRPVAATRSRNEVGSSSEEVTAYQVKGQFLPQFLKECKKRRLNLATEDGDPQIPVGKYAYEEGHDSLPYHPPSIQQTFHDPENHRDIWHDMREELICGRLLGAFPTFYVALIDGGRRLRIYRMFDHLYGMQAITQIAVHRRRNGPVETAVVGFSNMYGHLTAQAADQARINSLDTRGTWGLEAVFRGFSSFVRIDDETLVEWAQVVESLFLKPGARLHIRLGYGCTDEETEILTENGWRRHHQLSEGDVVLTLNHETGLSEWQPISRVNRYEVEDEEMVEVEGLFHSSLTTRCHRWPVLHRKRSTQDDKTAYDSLREWKTSETLNTHDRIILSATNADLPTKKAYSDALVELVAWFWTEGTIHGNGKCAYISQSQEVNLGNVGRIRQALTLAFGPSGSLGGGGDNYPEDKRREVLQALEANQGNVNKTKRETGVSHPTIIRWRDQQAAVPSGMFLMFTPTWVERHRNGRGEVQFRLNAAASKLLLKIAPNKVVSTEFIRSLTQEQLDLFIHVSELADGRSGYSIGQSDPKRLEPFELACILAGKRTHFYSRLDKTRDYLEHIVGFSDTKTRGFGYRESRPARTRYTGTVWCPTTPNGTWLARRRGTAYFTGNSDCSQLPVVFNGVVTEVPLTEGEVQVVALSDGIELTNDLAPTDLQGSMPVTRLNSFLGEGMNPREIVTTFMAPNPTTNTLGDAVGQTLDAAGFQSLAGLFYGQTTNAYGIEHYGSPTRSFLGFDDAEIGVNLWNPESSAPYNNSSAWDNTLRIFQFWRWDKNKGLIGINMAQATPWQIFETCRKSVPDYILYSAPFELRSTLFMGKGWFPLFYRYKDELPEFTPDTLLELPREAVMDWKPFQQVHLITSDWNLLGNDVRAQDVIGTQVQAVGTYNGWLPGADLSNEASFVMMLDSDIYVEHQKLKLVESGLYADVNMKFGDANSDEGGQARVLLGTVMAAAGVATLNPGLLVGGLASLAEGPIRSFLLSRRVEDYFAAATLKDYVKDMYQGNLTIFGAPHIKPFDLLTIADNLSGLHGLCETKSVTHTMSVEQGFVTTVEPDCISTFLDFEGRDLYLWAAITGGHMVAAYGMAKVLGDLARRGSAAVLLRGIRRLSRWVDSEVKRLATGRGATSELFQKLSLAEARVTAGELKGIVNEAVASVRAGNTAKLTELLAKIAESRVDTAASAGGATLGKLLNAAPQEIRHELLLQNALRGIPTSKGGQWTLKQAGKGVDKVREIARDARLKSAGHLAKAARSIEEKQAELAKLGFSEERLAELAKDLRQGGKLGTSERQAVRLTRQIKSLQRVQKQAGAVVNTLEKTLPETAELLGTVGRQVFSKANVGLAIFSAVNIALGGLADYIVRTLAARQCLTIYPLKVHGNHLEAGINGHRGAVAGDRLGQLDGYIQNVIDGWGPQWVNTLTPFLPVIGDVITSGINYRAPEIPSFIGDNTTERG